MTRGVFFSLDGVDGAGKSTQLALLCEWLGQLGHAVVTCRDPGSTRLGEAVRAILLERHDLAIARRSEMLLYMAARAQLVEELIQPALARGQTVVSDRYLLANVAYQAYGGGLDVAETWQVGQTATAGLIPDLTVVLDIDVELASRRLQRPCDRMESQGSEFFQRVRQGFLSEAARQPDKIVVVDASQAPELVHAHIRRLVIPWLRSREHEE